MAPVFQGVRLPEPERSSRAGSRASRARPSEAREAQPTLERSYVELSEAYERLASEFRQSIELSMSLCKQLEAAEQEKASLRLELSRSRKEPFAATNLRFSRARLTVESGDLPRATRKGPLVLPSHSASEQDLRVEEDWLAEKQAPPRPPLSAREPAQTPFDLQKEHLRAQLADLAQKIDTIQLRNSKRAF